MQQFSAKLAMRGLAFLAVCAIHVLLAVTDNLALGNQREHRLQLGHPKP